MSKTDRLVGLKSKFKKHPSLYFLTGCPYLAPRWNKWMRRLINDLGANARILELGAGAKRRSSHIINLDVEYTSNVDIVADGHHLPFGTETFDAVIMEAVLEHVRNPNQIVTEAHRVLKKGGYICAAVPFLHSYHASPNDYYRYTATGFDMLFADFHKVDSGACSGPSTALHSMMREYIGYLFSFGNLWVQKLISLLIGWITYPIVLLDSLLMLNKNAHMLAQAVFFIGKK